MNQKKLLLQDGCQIISSSSNRGKSGSLTIDTKEQIVLSGFDKNEGQGCLISSGFRGDNNISGEISITTPQLFLKDGAQIESVNTGFGNSGHIKINNAALIVLEGTCRKNGEGSSIVSRIDSIEPHNGVAGNIHIHSENLMLNDGAWVSSKTLGGGQGGDIIIATTEELSLSGKDQNGQSSIISASAIGDSKVSGDAGSIHIS
ncbi:MAG: hypothetical protein OMM_14304, partial [Candidatus Magnetoglobus multicellularis str. Araruama]